jgi:hypothetical protein
MWLKDIFSYKGLMKGDEILTILSPSSFSSSSSSSSCS